MANSDFPYVTVDQACRLLLNENVVAVPTETVYGLAALATSKKAIEKIFEIKNRPADNPLICHFHEFRQAVPYLKPYPAYVEILQKNFSPGPISFLLPLKEKSELQNAVRGQHNVIVRVPAHPLFLDLLRCVNIPLAAPSANTSGKYSATNAAMVAADLGDKADGIVNGGESKSGIESTIVDCTDLDAIRILRPGSIGKSDIERVLKNHGMAIDVVYAQPQFTTPGASYKHYAPLTPVQKINSLNEVPDEQRICLLADENTLAESHEFFNKYKNLPHLLSLGPADSPSEIARNLYALMARLDALKVDRAYLLYPAIHDDDWNKAIAYRLDKISGLR